MAGNDPESTIPRSIVGEYPATMPDVYVTLASTFRFEPERVKGSRFLADLSPAETPDQAAAFVERIRAEFPDATHHCYAWRLGMDGMQTRANDDGEPGGSAGRPILAQIEGHGVTGVVAVVTRYFGGTKLGVGGLMRAYGGAAGQALDRAPLEERAITERWEVRFPYACSGAVEGVLHGLGLQLERGQYGSQVQGEVSVARSQAAEFARQIADRTAGKGIARPLGI